MRRPAAPLPSPRLPAVDFDTLARATPEALAAAFVGPPEEAARWIVAAARSGYPDAQLLLGQILLDGRGVPQDHAAAFAWFGIAAGTGDARAVNMLGRCHENGWGTPPDEEAAAALYARAAEAGLDWAQYNLANMLARGAGIAQDRAAALGWYRRAAAQGHAKATNLVARFLEEGWEVPADPLAAATLYARAAAGGDFRAQFNLGTMRANQGEVAEAARLFRAAARTGTPKFRHTMAERLRARPEPELRRVAEEIGA